MTNECPSPPTYYEVCKNIPTIIAYPNTWSDSPPWPNGPKPPAVSFSIPINKHTKCQGKRNVKESRMSMEHTHTPTTPPAQVMPTCTHMPQHHPRTYLDQGTMVGIARPMLGHTPHMHKSYSAVVAQHNPILKPRWPYPTLKP